MNEQATYFGNLKETKKLAKRAEKTLEAGVPASTKSNESTAIGWWTAFCDTVKVDPWVNRGSSPRAIWFNTILLMLFLEWTVPRMNNHAGGLPSSARGYTYLIMGVMARTKGFIFQHSSKRIKSLIKGLEWQWREKNGPRKIDRKKPFTPFQLETWRGIFSRSLHLAQTKVVLVMIALAFGGMFRRSEYTLKSGKFAYKTSLARSHVKWYDAQGRRLILSRELLSLPPVGMYCTVNPPPCKNDRDGSKFHDDPLIFEFDSAAGGIGTASLLCVANYLWGLEREFPMFKEKTRARTPLFVDPNTGKGFTTAVFDAIIKGVMYIARSENPGAGFPDPSQQSLHSFRAGGALALKAAGAPPDVIKAMGRWRSDTWELYIRDRRGEAMHWGRKMRGVARLDVAQVPLIDRFCPENAIEPVNERLRAHKETQDMIDRLNAMEIEETPLDDHTAEDLAADFDSLMQDLAECEIPRPEQELAGEMAMARAAQAQAKRSRRPGREPAWQSFAIAPSYS